MDKNIRKTIAVEIICFLMQIVFSKIEFLEMICPFGFPFALIRVFYGGNIFSIIFAYLISKIHTFLIFSDIFVCFYEIVILSLFYFVKNFKINNKPLLSLEIAAVVSTALQFYYVLTIYQSLTLFFVELLIKIILIAFFYRFFAIFKSKFLFFKFSNLDYLYFSLISMFIAMGIYSFSLNVIRLDYFILALIVIVSCKILPNDKFFVLALSVGMGALFAARETNFLLFSALLSVVLINFKNRNKFIYLAVSILSVFLVLIFDKTIDLISMGLACLPSLVLFFVPTKFFEKCAALFEINALDLMCENLRKEKILEIKSKLSLMSSTLKNMQRDFKFLLVGKVSRDKACTELSHDIINSCCKNCENYRICFFENINKRLLFENLLSKAIEKGKINKDDVTMGLQAYCLKEGIIVSEINQIATAFIQFEKSVKSEDSSKLMIADELGNFADIFSSFAKFIKLDMGFNKKQSSLLKEELLNDMIDAKEVLILEHDTGIESINLIAQNNHILKKELADGISRFSRARFKLGSVRHLNYSGLSLATFVPCEKLKMNVTVSTKAKENKNGDNVLVSKLSQNRFFVAIADGMGHGENAHRISSMVLSLIRSMFEIGFDDELIIQSINKLIIPAGLDSFTSLDACVIDLDKEMCTFIKLGASVSILKHQNTSEIISCASLPMGIVANIKPTISRKHLSINDTIFLASDGIVDSFSNVEAYRNYINDARIGNMQKYLDDVVFDASFQNKKHPDDMTIIAINLLKNYSK